MNAVENIDDDEKLNNDDGATLKKADTFSSYSLSVFVNQSMAGAFVCVQCNNVPAVPWTNSNGDVVCEGCIHKKLDADSDSTSASANVNLGLKKMIHNLRVKCLNNRNQEHQKDHSPGAGAEEEDEGEDELEGMGEDESSENENMHAKEKQQESRACQWVGKLSEFENHNNECKLRLVDECPYRKYGCAAATAMTTRQLEQHLQTEQLNHIQLQVERVTKQNLNLRKHQKVHDANIQKLMDENAQLKDTLSVYILQSKQAHSHSESPDEAGNENSNEVPLLNKMYTWTPFFGKKTNDAEIDSQQSEQTLDQNQNAQMQLRMFAIEKQMARITEITLGKEQHSSNVVHNANDAALTVTATADDDHDNDNDTAANEVTVSAAMPLEIIKGVYTQTTLRLSAAEQQIRGIAGQSVYTDSKPQRTEFKTNHNDNNNNNNNNVDNEEDENHNGRVALKPKPVLTAGKTCVWDPIFRGQGITSDSETPNLLQFAKTDYAHSLVLSVSEISADLCPDDRSTFYCEFFVNALGSGNINFMLGFVDASISKELVRQKLNGEKLSQSWSEDPRFQPCGIDVDCTYSGFYKYGRDGNNKLVKCHWGIRTKLSFCFGDRFGFRFDFRMHTCDLYYNGHFYATVYKDVPDQIRLLLCSRRDGTFLCTAFGSM